MKKRLKRIIAMVLASTMAITIAPTGASVQADTSYVEEASEEATTEGIVLTSEEGETEAIIPEVATEPDSMTEENTENTEVTEPTESSEAEKEAPSLILEEVSPEEFETETEDMTEAITEVNTEENTEEATDTEKELPTESTEEAVQEEEIPQLPSFAQPVSGVDVSGIDFSSMELLIGTGDTNIFTWDTEVISEYNGIYLTRYSTVEETKNAYTYYYTKADFVSANITFKVTDEAGETGEFDESELNKGDDALSTLNKIENTSAAPDKTIALIDTGVNASDLIESVSLIGGSVSDDNGHGTRMYNYIKEEYAGAKILSVKAMDAGGIGQASDIYAAIEYAIQRKVDVINLSVSAYSTVENEVVKTAIEEAVSKGIIVIGAAGNDGKNVKYYIPGNIDKAVIAGACDATGKKIDSSNYGATVDYNIVAQSTSEASARLSGIYVRDGKAEGSKGVFSPSFTPEGEEEQVFIPDTDPFRTAADYPFTYDEVDYKVPGSITMPYTYSGGTGRYLGDTWYDASGNSYNRGTILTISSWGSVGGWSVGGDFEIVSKSFFCITRGAATPPASSGTMTLYRSGAHSNGVVTYKGTATIAGSGYQKVGMQISIRPKSHDYFYAIKKLDKRGKPINQVTFDVWVKNNTTGAETTRTAGAKSGAWTGYAYDFVNNKHSGRISTYTNRTTAASGNASWTVGGNTYSIARRNGCAIIYVGKYQVAPNISIREHWSTDWATGGSRGEYVKDAENSPFFDYVTPDEYNASKNETITGSWSGSADSGTKLNKKYYTIDGAIKQMNAHSGIGWVWTNQHYEDYYASITKTDDDGNLMNGVTFDVYINGTKKSHQLKTGKYYNGSTESNTSKGIGTYYLGYFASEPTVKMDENWTGTATGTLYYTEGGKEKSKTVHASDYTEAKTKNVGVYTSKDQAEQNAGLFTFVNRNETPYYHYFRIRKNSSVTPDDYDDDPSMEGIIYTLHYVNALTDTEMINIILDSKGRIARAVQVHYPTNHWSFEGVIEHNGFNYLSFAGRRTTTGLNIKEGIENGTRLYLKEKKTNDNYLLTDKQTWIALKEDKYPAFYTTQSATFKTDYHFDNPTALRDTPVSRVRFSMEKTSTDTEHIYSMDGITYGLFFGNPNASKSNRLCTFTLDDEGKVKTVTKNSSYSPGSNISTEVDGKYLKVTITGSTSGYVSGESFFTLVELTTNGNYKKNTQVSRVEPSLLVNGNSIIIGTSGSIINSSNYGDSTKDTPYKPYFAAVAKLDESGRPIDGVPFDVIVNRGTASEKSYTTTANDTTKGVWTGSIANLDNGVTYSNRGYDPSTLNKVSTTKKFYLTTGGGHRIKDEDGDDVYQEFTQMDGVALIYLGTYDSPPTVHVKEAWSRINNSAQIIGDETETTVSRTNVKPSDFIISSAQYPATVSDSISGVTNAEIREITNQNKIHITLDKKSSEPSRTDTNPNYNLTGTTYEVYTSEDAAKERDQTAYIGKFVVSNKNGTSVISYDKNGLSSSTGLIDVHEYMNVDDITRLYADTEFYAIETVVGKGYKKNTAPISVTVKPENRMINGVAHPAKFEATDEPVDDPFRLSVMKKVIGGTTTTGIPGAKFTVKYYALDTTGGYSFNSLQNEVATEETVITTTTTGATLNKNYDLGYITIEETVAPEGYSLDGANVTINGSSVSTTKLCFALLPEGNSTNGYTNGLAHLVDSNGNISAKPVRETEVENDPIALQYEEVPKRGDLSIEKRGKSDEPLSGVRFEIKSKATGETHYVMTDANGKVATSSTYVKHSTNTNRYDNSTTYLGKSGVWFEQVKSGNAIQVQTVTDSEGALPVGEYTVREVSNNGNYQKEEPITVIISENSIVSVYDSAKADTEEVIYDMPTPTIWTEAWVVRGTVKDKYAAAVGGIDVNDIVHYENLRVGTTFTIVSKIMEVTDTGLVEFATTSHAFTTDRTRYNKSLYEATGSTTVEFTNLNFTDKAGAKFVIFHNLYYGTVTEGSGIVKKYPNSNNDLVTFPIPHEKADDDKQTFYVNGTIQVHKTLSTSGDPSGAEYTVYRENGSAYAVMTIDSTGYSNKLANVPYGKYTIRETKAPTNGTWLKDTNIYTATVTSGKKSVSLNVDLKADTGSEFVVESEDYGETYAFIKKSSANTTVTNGNPNYSLKNAVYKVFTSEIDAQDALTSGKYNKAIGTLTTDEDGKTEKLNVYKWMDKTKASTTFYVVEATAPKGYLRDTTVKSVKVTWDNVEANPAELDVADQPVTVPFNLLLAKVDKLTGDGNTAAGTSLAGAKFTINFYKAEVGSEHNTAASTQVITVSKNANGTYSASFQRNMPLGYISIEETTLPAGYTKDGSNWTVGTKSYPMSNPLELFLGGTFNEDHSQFTAAVYNPLTAKSMAELPTKGEKVTSTLGLVAVKAEDTTIRGDVEVRKIDLETGSPVKNVKFEIKNTDTNEVHYIYTNENGLATTQTATYRNVNYYDTHAFDSTPATVWFEKGTNGAIAPKNGESALPVGHYTLTEVDCDANAGYQRNEPIVFEIKSLEDGGINGQLYTASTSTDGKYYEAPQPKMTSVATVNNGMTDKLSYARNGIRITDRVNYYWLKNSTRYTMVGKIMEIKNNGEVSEFATSNPVAFTTAAGTGKSMYEACGYVDVTFTGLDFTGKQGSSFVVYQYLYLGNDTSGSAVMTSYGNSNNVTFPLAHDKKDDTDQIFDVCGTIQVHKILDTDGDPSGAQYTIKGITNPAFSKVVTIGANGYSEIADVPTGQYSIKETKLPTNGEWNLDTTEYLADIKAYSGTKMIGSTLTAASEGIVESTDYPVVKAYLKKSSTDAEALNNVNYSLKDTTYNLYETKADAEAFIKGTANAVIATFKTDENGDTETVDLSAYMHGVTSKKFYLVETKGAKNHLRTKDPIEVTVLKTNNSTNPAKFEVEDTPVKVPSALKIEKVEKLTKNSNLPEGNTLEGAEFTVEYYPSDVTKATYEGQSASKEVLTVTKDKDGNFTASLSKDYYFGFLVIKETKLPKGYTKDNTKITVGGVEVTEPIVIRLAGTFAKNQAEFTPGYSLADGTAISKPEIKAENASIRGDVEVTKVDLDGNPIKGVKFEVKNTDTNEIHYIYTDANGVATTKTASYTNVNYYDAVSDYDGTAATVWFKKGTKGDIPATDGEYALPVGHYTLTELPCKANENYQTNEADTFEIYSPEDNGTNGQIHVTATSADGKYYEAPLPEIKTNVIVVNGRTEKISKVASGVTIEDELSYTNLKNETTFTAVGTIMEVNGESVTPFLQNGHPVTATKEFTTAAGTGKSLYEASDTVKVTFDNLDFSKKQGATFVIYQRVYLGTITEGAGILTTYGNANTKVKFPLLHENPKDKNQTFEVEGTIQIHKTLNLAGDPSGAEYTVKGITDPTFEEALVIGRDGYSQQISVPFGQYTIKETKLPTNGEWTWDENEYKAEIKSAAGTKTIGVDMTSASEALVESADYAKTFVVLEKKSDDSTVTGVNYSLKGAKYKLYADKAKAEAALSRKNYDDALGTFETDENGQTGIIDVTEWMKGADEKEFYAVESESAKNYLRSTKVASVVVKKDNVRTNPAKFEVTDTPVKVPAHVQIKKHDALTKGYNTAKGKTLDGAKFTVAYYESDVTAASYAGNPTSNETYTVTKKNNKYEINWDKTLNLGWLVIEEIELPKEYTKTGAKITVGGVEVTEPIVIRLSGTYSNDNAEFTPKYTLADGTEVGTLEVVVENTPLRGDLGLIKKDIESGAYMKGVEFEIENLETHEKHIMVTDENGVATTKTDKYTADSVWFSEGEMAKIDPVDGYGALPYGKYRVTELRCDANKGYQLNAPIDVEISEREPYATLATALTPENGQYYFYNVPSPIIETSATVKSTGIKSMPQDGAGQKGEPQTIVDNVNLKWLKANSTFTLVGTLMVVDHGKTYAYKNGNQNYVVTKTFTTGNYNKSPYDICMTETMEYTDIYPENYEGCSFVVYNKLYYGTNTTVPAQYEEIANLDLFPLIHEDIKNKAQTVEVADIGTKAEDGVNKEQIVKPEGKIEIVDFVRFSGLTIGESYTISGDLHVTGYTWKDKDGKEIKNVSTDEPLKDAQGKVITASDTFVATTSAGTRKLTFEIDADKLQGQSIVVFENLYYKDIRLAFHADLKDSSETIHFPNMHTTLYRAGTGDWAEDLDKTDITKATTVDESSKEVMAADKAVVVDRIKVHNILANREYVVKGILMDKATKQPLLDAKGKQVTVEQKYTAPTVNAVEDTNSPHADKYICEDGTVLIMSADHGDYLVDDIIEVTFPEFDASNLGKHTTVAYEELYLLKDGKEILVSDHKEIEDNDQAVRFIEIGTEANVEESRTKMVTVDKEITINDEVSFSNAVIGKSYSLTASIVVKNDKSGYYKDGDALLDTEGKPVTATITFTPDKTEGTVIVPIKFTGYITEEMDLVCYEDMKNDKGLTVAVHNSLTDEEQTTYKAWIGTTATVDGNHFVLADNKVKITDECEIHNIIPGLKYRTIGELHRKSDGSSLGITAEKTFTTTKKDDVIKIEFPEIDASPLRGDGVVVYEKLYVVVSDKFEAEIANHEKLDSAEQTIIFPELRTTLYRAGVDAEWIDEADNASTKEVMAAENASVIDKVVCKNLIPGEFILKGVLMDKATKLPALDAEGNEIHAEKKFTVTKAGDVTESVIFNFDASKLGNHTLVAYEDLYLITADKKEVLVGKHHDIDDYDQTVRFVEIHTDASAEETKTQMVGIGEETTINDTVHFANVVPHREYELTATVYVVHDKAGIYKDGEALKTVEGKAVTKTIKFTPEKEEGDVVVPITFKGHITSEMTMICFEDMKNDKGLTVAVHNDLTDKRQATYKVWLGTTATVNDKHFVMADNSVEVTDVCAVHNAIPGLKYRVEGKMVRKSDGSFIKDSNGNIVTASTEFVAEDTDCEATVVFPAIDASDLRGDDLVVFETLRVVVSEDFSAILNIHENLDDMGQTISFPNIHTTLYRYSVEEKDIQDDSAKEVLADSDAKVIDRVYLEHMIAGQYVLRGRLMDKATGKAAKDANGKEIVKEKKFSITGEGFVDQYEEVIFKFDATGLGNHTYVAFEELYLIDETDNSKRLMSRHEDIDDLDQTVRFPSIGTKASTDSESQIMTVGKETTVYDTVKYHNLIPNTKTYTVTATLVVSGDKTGFYKDGDNLKDVDGNVISKTITFIPKEPDGEIVVPITFSGYLVPETRIICFETLKNDKGLVIATHNDIEDRDQSTYVVDISTKARVNGMPIAFGGINVDVEDEVSYRNALPGLTYRIKSSMVVRSTGEKVDGVTAETTFKAEKADGSIIVKYPSFDATQLQGESVVCYEKLYLVVDGNEYEIARHESIDDAEQTIQFPKVGTEAAAVEKNNKLMVSDTVKFANLDTSYTYVAKGWLVTADGNAVVIDGQEIVAEKEFTIDSPDGSIGVAFPSFDPYYMYGGRVDVERNYKYIVFEELYVKDEDGTLHKVGEHRDLGDKKQTVDGNAVPQTGDDTPIIPLFLLLMLSAAGILVVWRKKKEVR